MPMVDSHLLDGIELISFPHDRDITSERVRTEMFAWCLFVVRCKALANENKLANYGESDARCAQWAMMAHEAIDRVNCAARFADRLDEIEQATGCGRAA